MTELVRISIEKANEDLKKDNETKLIEQVLIVSSSKDIIGDGHMVIGQNGKLVEDRFGTKKLIIIFQVFCLI